MSENPTAVICTQDLHKVYMMGENEVHALRGITLDVPRGQFLAVMGASGSGKSTFVNILGCLDRPTRGKYWMEGEDVSLLSADERAKVRKSRIGFVFQGFNLLQRTTALENVEMPLHYVRMSSRERRERARAMLDAVGLSDRSHHYPSQLSGGQQQRVAVARALINHPAIVLADEPTGNLDSRTAVEIMELLQRLNAEHGITVILITHEDDIARFAGRQIVFRDGRLKSDHAVSSPAIASEVLRSRPAVEQEEP